MNENDDYKRFLPDDEPDNPRVVFEVPAEQNFPYQEKLPSGYDPMGEIALRGRAARTLSSGKASWWFFIPGWVIFGGSFQMALFSVITTHNFILIPVLFILSIIIVILWRGTVAKLSTKKSRSRRN